MFVQLYALASIRRVYVWADIYIAIKCFVVLLTNDPVWEELFKTVLIDNLLCENQHLIIPSLNTRKMLVMCIFI